MTRNRSLAESAREWDASAAMAGDPVTAAAAAFAAATARPAAKATRTVRLLSSGGDGSTTAGSFAWSEGGASPARSVTTGSRGRSAERVGVGFERDQGAARFVLERGDDDRSGDPQSGRDGDGHGPPHVGHVPSRGEDIAEGDVDGAEP